MRQNNTARLLHKLLLNKKYKKHALLKLSIRQKL